MKNSKNQNAAVAEREYVEDVLVPMAQSFLKAANEYGWDKPSCAPGSMNFVLATLEGRMAEHLEREQKNSGTTAASGTGAGTGGRNGSGVSQLAMTLANHNERKKMIKAELKALTDLAGASQWEAVKKKAF